MTALPRLPLPVLLILVLLFFAGNSILTRLALADARISPTDFAALRTVSGAIFLLVLAKGSGASVTWSGRLRITGAMALLAYMLGFTFAYLSLETGTGALILFGGTQITMVVGALMGGEKISPLRWVGMGLALAGLLVLCWPSGSAPLSPLHAGLMGIAAVGWGLYSLAGRQERDPLGSTAANFALAAVPIAALVLVLPHEAEMTLAGVALALISGMLASGLGYALWYSVLPRLTASAAALAQLTVPLIAAAGGAVLLAEWPGWRFSVAAILVLGGIGLGIFRPAK